MLGEANKVFYLVKSGHVLVRSWFRNRLPYSMTSKDFKGCPKPKQEIRFHVHDDKYARIVALTARIKRLEARIKEMEKNCQSKKSKMFLGKLKFIVKDLENALRELRQLV